MPTRGVGCGEPPGTLEDAVGAGDTEADGGGDTDDDGEGETAGEGETDGDGDDEALGAADAAGTVGVWITGKTDPFNIPAANKTKSNDAKIPP